MTLRPALLATLAVCAVFGAGCGSQPAGQQTSLVITRDFGNEAVAQPQEIELTAGLTAMRQLQASQKTTTTFGGRYIDSIDGVKEDGDSSWLIYVDGIEVKKGASAIRLKAGQRVQWDFHPWQTIRTGGAIVGAYPRPLTQKGVHLVCADQDAAACTSTREQLSAASIRTVAHSPFRVVVGTWRQIDGFDGVPDLTVSGETNGAFASFSADGRKLTPYFADGSAASAISGGGGLLAAFASDQGADWLVTGTDAAGVLGASKLLADDGKALKDRFALAVDDDGSTPLPLVSER